MRWGWPGGTSHGANGGFQEESSLVVICPGGHQQRGARDLGGD